MPFTFAHPAIIFPLTYLPKKWFSLTGLIIGSMIPDFEYFLRMRIQSNYSHTLNGLFWFDLPLGLLVAFLFHTIARDQLFNNLPDFLKFRFSIFKRFDWNQYFKKNWYVVMISILIGALSHIFWDSFTHDSGYFVQKLPILRDTIDILGKQIPVLKIAQHTSTLFGICTIVLILYKLPLTKIEKSEANPKYWIVVTILSFIIIIMRFIVGLELKEYGNLIVTTIAALLISLIITPLFLRSKIFS